MPSSCCWQSSKGEAQLSNWVGWEEREPVWFLNVCLETEKKKSFSASLLQPRTCRRVRVVFLCRVYCTDTPVPRARVAESFFSMWNSAVLYFKHLTLYGFLMSTLRERRGRKAESTLSYVISRWLVGRFFRGITQQMSLRAFVDALTSGFKRKIGSDEEPIGSHTPRAN